MVKSRLSASAYSVTDLCSIIQMMFTINKLFDPIIAANLNSTQTVSTSEFKETFDYRHEIQILHVSYIACRNSEIDIEIHEGPLRLAWYLLTVKLQSSR